jgi:hypothetical protein
MTTSVAGRQSPSSTSSSTAKNSELALSRANSRRPRDEHGEPWHAGSVGAFPSTRWSVVPYGVWTDAVQHHVPARVVLGPSWWIHRWEAQLEPRS